MTFNKTSTAFTDYPFTDLGDTDNEPAPIREIEVLTYDRDKYALVRVKGTGVQLSIKAGYIFKDKLLSTRVKKEQLYTLPLFAGGNSHTRKQVATVLRKERKRVTKYSLYTASEKFRFSTLKSALAHMVKLRFNSACHLYRVRTTEGFSLSSEEVISSEFGEMYLIDTKRQILKTKNFRKYFCK